MKRLLIRPTVILVVCLSLAIFFGAVRPEWSSNSREPAGGTPPAVGLATLIQPSSVTNACAGIQELVRSGDLAEAESALDRLTIAPVDGSDCYAQTVAALAQRQAEERKAAEEDAEQRDADTGLGWLADAWSAAETYWRLAAVLPIAWIILRIVGNSLAPPPVRKQLWLLRRWMRTRSTSKALRSLDKSSPGWIVDPLVTASFAVAGVAFLVSANDDLTSWATGLWGGAALTGLIVGGAVLQGISPRIKFGSDPVELPQFSRLVEAALTELARDEPAGVDRVIQPDEYLAVSNALTEQDNVVAKAVAVLMNLVLPDVSYSVGAAISGRDAAQRGLAVSVQRGRRVVDSRFFRFDLFQCAGLDPEAAGVILAAPVAGFAAHTITRDWFGTSPTLLSSADVSSQMYTLAGGRWLEAQNLWKAQQCYVVAINSDAANQVAWLNLALIDLRTRTSPRAWLLLRLARGSHQAESDQWDNEAGQLLSRVALNQMVYYVNSRSLPNPPDVRNIEGEVRTWAEAAAGWLSGRKDPVSAKRRARIGVLMKMMCDSGTSGTNTAGRQAVASPDHDPIDLLREYGNQYDRDSQTFVWLFDVACAAAETNGRDVRSVMGLLELAMLHDRVLASISGRGGAQRDPVIWKWRETLSSDLQHDWDLLVEECSRAYRDANQEAPESPTKHDLTVHWFSRPKWWPR